MLKRLKMLWEQELENASLWFVVFFACGILIYFKLPIEPPIFIGLVSAFISGVLWILLRRDLSAYYFIGYLFFACLGFSIISVKTHLIRAPILTEPLFDYPVTGTVRNVRVFMNAQQLILKDVKIDGLADLNTPKYIRMNVPTADFIFKSGDKIETSAHILPPRAPVVLNGYHYGRTDYFNQIGASVHPTEPVELIERSTQPSKIENIRQFIAARVKSLLPNDTAGVVIPLIIGEQGTVPKEIYESYRKTGIVHVLSVSGFHLALLSGFVFFLIRGLLSCVPFLALRLNTKKIAAFISILFTFGYLLISGMAVPAIRSFIMICVVLLGVLLNRNALSLRSVSLAAFFILMIWPESVLSASFQLSFMAILSLVTLYTALMRYLKEHHFTEPGIFRFLGLFLLGLVAVSMLAGIATAPYTVYHFNQYANYGVLGNLLTDALFSFCIMPVLLFAVLMMPFGLDAPLIHLAGHCLDLVADMCTWVSGLPYASLTIPSMPDGSIFVMTIGLLMIFIMRTRLRWIGLIVCVGALTGYIGVKTPDILVAEGGRVFAVKDGSGRLVLSNLDNRFITDIWLRRNGQDPDAYLPTHLFSKSFVRINGRKIAFSSLDCATADLTFRLFGKIGECPNREITRSDLWRDKTHAVFVSDDNITVYSVLDFIDKRPWHPDFMLAPDEKISYDMDKINENGD